jgi:hypothetical protein
MYTRTSANIHKILDNVRKNPTVASALRSVNRPLFKIHEKDSELIQLYNKASEHSFSDSPVPVLPSASSPQAIQGMWQAYGQMRAARITAGGAIVASGVFAGSVFSYNKYMENNLKDTKEELNNTKEELINTKEQLELDTKKL